MKLSDAVLNETVDQEQVKRLQAQIDTAQADLERLKKEGKSSGDSDFDAKKKSIEDLKGRLDRMRDAGESADVDWFDNEFEAALNRVLGDLANQFLPEIRKAVEKLGVSKGVDFLLDQYPKLAGYGSKLISVLNDLGFK